MSREDLALVPHTFLTLCGAFVQGHDRQVNEMGMFFWGALGGQHLVGTPFGWLGKPEIMEVPYPLFCQLQPARLVSFCRTDPLGRNGFSHVMQKQYPWACFPQPCLFLPFLVQCFFCGGLKQWNSPPPPHLVPVKVGGGVSTPPFNLLTDLGPDEAQLGETDVGWRTSRTNQGRQNEPRIIGPQGKASIPDSQVAPFFSYCCWFLG